MARPDVLPVDDQTLEHVRFGRNRFLGAAGGVLFGALAMFFGRTELAWGLCGTDVLPCYGLPFCCCCSGTACCQNGCFQRNYKTCFESTWGLHCWNSCHPVGRITCCDWVTGNNNDCLCRANTGPC